MLVQFEFGYSVEQKDSFHHHQNQHYTVELHLHLI